VTAPAEALAAAAHELVGTPFRLHGRDPATGLDCVGVVHAAIAAAGGHPVPPRGYGLRNLAIDGWLPLAERSGLIPAAQPVHAGDVLLIALGFGQHHLVIACGSDEVIHAHAGLRRVVCQPRDPTWQVHGVWRLAPPLSES